VLEGIATPEAAPLSVHLHRERGGPSLGIEPVSARDLVDAVAEAWFYELCAGGAGVRLADFETRLRVVEAEDTEIGKYTAGFELLEPEPVSREPFSYYFPRECLAHVAARGARRLIEEGRLATGELYFYGLTAGDAPDALLRGPEGRGVPGLATAPLRRLLEGAEPVDVGEDDAAYPVFFTRSARERAERVSRKGGDVSPPVETGGLLIGPLCRCPETGQLFAVVVQVLEATESEATKYSLTYSGPTWARVQALLRAQQAHPTTRHHRILGQSHGHNFLPFEGAEPCAACRLVDVCTRSSAYLSADDRTWCRAVFSGEPWQLSQVFGMDARSGGTETFYGQLGGGLTRRGYWVIDELRDDGLA